MNKEQRTKDTRVNWKDRKVSSGVRRTKGRVKGITEETVWDKLSEWWSEGVLH